MAYFQKADPSVNALRDVTMDQVMAAEKHLPEVVFKRCRHVVGEIGRTPEMAQNLVDKNYYRAGELMVASHHSLRTTTRSVLKNSTSWSSSR